MIYIVSSGKENQIKASNFANILHLYGWLSNSYKIYKRWLPRIVTLISVLSMIWQEFRYGNVWKHQLCFCMLRKRQNWSFYNNSFILNSCLDSMQKHSLFVLCLQISNDWFGLNLILISNRPWICKATPVINPWFLTYRI